MKENARERSGVSVMKNTKKGKVISLLFPEQLFALIVRYVELIKISIPQLTRLHLPNI